MKTLLALFTATVLCAFQPACAQQTFEGFWGMPFGTNVNQTLAAAKTKNKTSVLLDGAVHVYNAVFARKTGRISLLFSSGVYRAGGFMMNKTSTAITLQTYEDFKTAMTEKYGAPEYTLTELPSYIKGTDYLLLGQAIKDGEARYMTSWRVFDKKGYAVIIALQITTDVELLVGISEVEAAEEKIKNDRAVQSKDY